MPACTQIVPKNAAGEREVEGWVFYYKGWFHHLNKGDFWRNEASGDNIFPPDCILKLGDKLLKDMGLN